MKYTMNVTIYNPETPEGMISDLYFKLTCRFVYDEGNYGNGHYCSIEAKDFGRQVFDLRYDTSFNRNEKEKWLEAWARNYWSGTNGAYAVKALSITKAE